MSVRELAVVTGANSGVGFEATRILAREGWEIVMVCRDHDRGEAARGRILQETPSAELRLEMCDLANLGQVRSLAERLDGMLTSEEREVSGLLNNAGLYRASLERTGDGFERTFAVNHLGHFLLTLLLEEHLRREGVRIVNVSSQGHKMGRLDRAPLPQIFRGEAGSYDGWKAYGDSKLANVLFSRELDRRWGDDGVVALSLHPGVLSTAIWDRNRTFGMLLAKLAKPIMDSPELGGRAAARLLMDPEVASMSGSYFKKMDAIVPAPQARDDEVARRLWEESLRAVGLGDRGS